MKVKTLGPVQHDGKNLKIGATIDLPEDAAVQLIDAGAAEAVGAEKAASTAKAESGDGQ